MSIRAVLFDVYKTIMEVHPPTREPESGWQKIWENAFGSLPRQSFDDFIKATRLLIEREQAQARGRGVPFPEVYWPLICLEAAPDLAALPAVALDDFLLEVARLQRSVRVSDACAAFLRQARGKVALRGIASNAQPYTIRELAEALRPHGLALDLFHPSLSVWSFDHGFSKPDPHIFRLLEARLKAFGIRAEEVLFVGDRVDNDIEPARRQGWNTWQIMEAPAGDPCSGGWEHLMKVWSENK